MFKTKGNDLVRRFPAGGCEVPGCLSGGTFPHLEFGNAGTTLAAQLCVSLALFPHYLIVEVVNGRRAIFLALFMATLSILWCFAQLPEILRGMILPRSVVKYLSILESL